MGETILKMQGIQKYFSGVHALNGVDFELKAGEVHALMGENGAGKSTLIKVLCGIHKRDGGTVTYFGKEVHFDNIGQSQAAGISVIHQELNMMNDLTVAQNMFIGQEKMLGGLIDDKAMERAAKEQFEKMGVDIDPSIKLGNLTVGKQQMVEIAKAVSRDCKLLVLDEPTAALTLPEVEELFKIMRDMKQKGIGMIYISHRMDEITRISDRVTVMRDGEYVGTVNTDEVTKDDIVKMMVGRVIMGEQKSASSCPADAPVILEVKNLNAGKEVKNVSFQLRKGEILGFAGLMGAGRTEVVRALYAANRHARQDDRTGTDPAIAANMHRGIILHPLSAKVWLNGMTCGCHRYTGAKHGAVAHIDMGVVHQCQIEIGIDILAKMDISAAEIAVKGCFDIAALPNLREHFLQQCSFLCLLGGQQLIVAEKSVQADKLMLHNFRVSRQIKLAAVQIIIQFHF